jgi:site-specific DNA recombinase
MADKIRCAIYTRKSTEEGLDQEFNSLHAQREAAEAYIKSQRHLGWTVVAQLYDDGGFTGANLDRPALQLLLEHVEARRIDCVVVYKVDRLSRSLLDFARLMGVFEQRSVSFVSVTQQFNTTTSLGRLTLNILSSFAQFERELISERTRDKMSAARRKGKWTGGIPMLGYDVGPRGGRLVVNEAEARRVREIFDLYRQHRSIAAVLEELHRRRWITKSWTKKDGSRRQGSAFTKNKLVRLLTNAIYAGKVEHKGSNVAGEQDAIVASDLWQTVNDDLRGARRGTDRVTHTTQNTLLRGVLFCGSCDQPMVPTYTAKGARRYRYYVCRAAPQKARSNCQVKSVAARRIEESVMAQVRSALAADDARSQLNVVDADWRAFSENESTDFLRRLIRRVVYNGTTGAVSLELGHED